jgi:NADH-quinone oxidoreductase subunit K
VTEAALLSHSLFVGGVLFALGLVGFLVRRNLIVMFLCAEMMLQGISVNFVAWGRYHNDWSGQVFVIMILTVAACEAALALALFLALFKRSGRLDIASFQSLREENQRPRVDREVPPPTDVREREWPKLTPAGIEPTVDVEEELFRSHV